eukprot:360433-Chlamydomonas_euryale.AAC.9
MPTLTSTASHRHSHLRPEPHTVVHNYTRSPTNVHTYVHSSATSSTPVPTAPHLRHTCCGSPSSVYTIASLPLSHASSSGPSRPRQLSGTDSSSLNQWVDQLGPNESPTDVGTKGFTPTMSENFGLGDVPA